MMPHQRVAVAMLKKAMKDAGLDRDGVLHSPRALAWVASTRAAPWWAACRLSQHATLERAGWRARAIEVLELSERGALTADMEVGGQRRVMPCELASDEIEILRGGLGVLMHPAGRAA